MLKNLPVGASRRSVMDLLHANGLEGLFNLVHVPFDFATGVAVGHATVNMETSYVAELATKLLKGLCIGSDPRRLEVCWNLAHQGLQELVDFYRNSRSMHASVSDEWKPMLLEKGLRVEFPAPTRSIADPTTSLA